MFFWWRLFLVLQMRIAKYSIKINIGQEIYSETTENGTSPYRKEAVFSVVSVSSV